MSSSLRVLLIDDDEDDKMFFIDALASIGRQINCEYFNAGEKALKWLTNTNELPHYIFLDLNMPKMNGLEVLKALKSQFHLQNIPVIIYSTSRNERHQQEAKSFGASQYVVKPYKQSELIQELISVFEVLKP